MNKYFSLSESVFGEDPESPALSYKEVLHISRNTGVSVPQM
jgi:hypothetical protein